MLEMFMKVFKSFPFFQLKIFIVYSNKIKRSVVKNSGNPTQVTEVGSGHIDNSEKKFKSKIMHTNFQTFD
jgi:hypothetical protein